MLAAPIARVGTSKVLFEKKKGEFLSISVVNVILPFLSISLRMELG
jgi:hypothetical protein